MRALPGRSSRTVLPASAANVTRSDVGSAQRSRIRRATGELVAKRGYGDVTVELIVKRARVSFGTFYKRYANKEEAFLDLFDVAVRRTRQLIEEALADADAPWPEQVALALRTFFTAIVDEPLIARACLVEAPTAGPRFLERYEEATRAFVPLLSAGREFDPAAPGLPATLEETLAGAIVWATYQRLVVGEAERLAELLPETVELVLRPYVGETEAARVASEVATATI